MTAIQFLLNLLWIVLGGFGMALGWVIAAVIMAITIIGIPWARAAFNIARYTLLPFGYKAVSRDECLGQDDIGTGRARHGRQHHLAGARRLVAGALPCGHSPSCLAITIIGIPFAWAHFKLAAHRAVADRQDDRAERLPASGLPAPGLKARRIVGWAKRRGTRPCPRGTR